MSILYVLPTYYQVFGETDKDTIETETTRIAFGFLGLATAVGLIYFIGVSSNVGVGGGVELGNICIMEATLSNNYN